jgi:hypothetical protein
MATVYLSRLRVFVHLARSVPVSRFEMGGQISENALLLFNIWEAKCKSDVQNPVLGVGPEALERKERTNDGHSFVPLRILKFIGMSSFTHPRK